MIYENHELATLMEDIVDPIDIGGRPLTEEEINIWLRKIHGHAKDSKILFAEHLKEPLRKEWSMIEDDTAIKSKKFKHDLTSKDKKVLITYAPKLFDTLLETKTKIAYKMYELVQLVWKYRLHQSPNYGYNRLRDDYSNTLYNDQKVYRESFVNHINRVLEIWSMAHDVSFDKLNDNETEIIKGDLPSSSEVKEILQIVRDNADRYIPRKPPKPSVDKNRSIGKYLKGLKLPDKTDEISEFIKAIK